MILIECRDNNDRIIYEESQRKDECKHREEIERLMKSRHNSKCDEKHEWNCCSGNECFSDSDDEEKGDEYERNSNESVSDEMRKIKFDAF